MAILNMIGGGGGGLAWDSAIIHVYAPAGSTVTAQKSGGTAVTLQEHTVSGADSEYIHIVKKADYGTYTITATKSGEGTATETANIERNIEYVVNIFYRIYLYRLGDKFVSVTGGWDFVNDSTYFSEGSYTDGEYSITLTAGQMRAIVARPKNKINLNPYSKLCANFVQVNATRGSIYLKVGNNSTGGGTVASFAIANGFTGVAELDISNITQELFLMIDTAQEQSGGPTIAEFTEMWLE